jgi:hypothetical protein
MSVFPCSSFENGTEHFKGINGKKEMNLKGNNHVNRRYDMNIIEVKKNETDFIVILTFQHSLGREGESSINKVEFLSFSFFNFSLGSTFEKKNNILPFFFSFFF